MIRQCLCVEMIRVLDLIIGVCDFIYFYDMMVDITSID